MVKKKLMSIKDVWWLLKPSKNGHGVSRREEASLQKPRDDATTSRTGQVQDSRMREDQERPNK